MIKLKTLVKNDCKCGDSCCTTNESINENVDDLKKIVKELEGASKMHKGQAERIQKHLEGMDESIVEGADDVRRTKRQMAMLIRQEGDFRKRMMNIEQGFLSDPNETNKKLATDIKKSYKDNVTKFMRDVVGMLRKMK
jgi:hypothetical protein